MFKLLGVLVALYTAHAAMTGRIYAKSGAWGKTVLRDESPRYFWAIVIIYAALSLALFFYF